MNHAIIYEVEKNLLKSDWFIAIRTEIILEKMQLATVLWKINWLNWWCDWMWDSRSDAGASLNILKEVHQSFRINSVNCYRRNRNRNRLNWILTKSLSDRFVCFFYSASEIGFNLIGLTSTVFHSELIEIFSCDTKKNRQLTKHESKRKIWKFSGKKTMEWEKKKRPSQNQNYCEIDTKARFYVVYSRMGAWMRVTIRIISRESTKYN